MTRARRLNRLHADGHCQPNSAVAAINSNVVICPSSSMSKFSKFSLRTGRHSSSAIIQLCCRFIPPLITITALLGKPTAEMRGVTGHIGSHRVTCHLTQVKTPRPALTPAKQASTRCIYPKGWKAELTLLLVIYRDGLPVHRQSSAIQVKSGPGT